MDALLGLILILPLPVWGAMLLFPRSRLTQRLVLSYWPYIALGGVYALLLAAQLVGGEGPGGLSRDALRPALAGDWGMLVALSHLTAIDLFVGVWIFRDAKYWGVNPGVFLLLTLAVGPIGLGAYLLARERYARRDPVRTLN